MKSANPSKTTNKLHFEDLNPIHFERLGFEFLNREFKWVYLDHTGALGNDGGVDILGLTQDGITYYGQVKRYKSLSPNQISEMISKIVENNSIVSEEAGFILFSGCDLSSDSIQRAYTEADAKDFKYVQLYTAIKIECALYEKYPLLLEKYFGTNNRSNKKSTQALVRKSIVKRKLVEKHLLRKDLYKKYSLETIEANPGLQFITDEFVLLSARSLLLPERYGEESSFCIAWPQRIIDEGIEFKMLLSQKIAFNIDSGIWRKIHNEKKCHTNEYILKDCQVMWLLPFHEINHIEPNGDRYYNQPIIIYESDFLQNGISKETYSFNMANIVFDEHKPLTPQEIKILVDHIKSNSNHYKE